MDGMGIPPTSVDSAYRLWVLESSSADLEDDTFAAVRVAPRAGANAPDFLHGPLRPPVLRAHQEDDAFHEAKSMLEHQPFHCAIVDAPPVRPGQERPPD